MTMYRVTAILNQQELIEYLDAHGNAAIEIVSMLDNAPASSGVSSQANKPQRHLLNITRRKRTSKVNDAILDRLHKGGADAADLRVSLEHAGLSPNSLSTGLALLQKDGKIRRGDGGVYELAA